MNENRINMPPILRFHSVMEFSPSSPRTPWSPRVMSRVPRPPPGDSTRAGFRECQAPSWGVHGDPPARSFAVPPALAALVHRAMEQHPERRVSSMGELRDGLRAALDEP